MQQSFRFFVSTARGLEPAVTQELRQLGLSSIKSGAGGASFEGSFEDAQRACLWLRTASRVGLVVAEGPCPSYDALYELACSVPWTEHLRPQQTLAVDATVLRSTLTHSHMAALKVKDAVVDIVRERRGQRPDVDTRSPDLRVLVWVLQDRALLAVDLCGEPLHIRHYRVQQTEAPLKETLAAGLLALSGWQPRTPLLDPFCGSGTLLIEAARIAQRYAPGRDRHFAFQQHPFFDGSASTRWQQLREHALAQEVKKPEVQLFASDWEPEALAATEANAIAAGVRALIHVSQADARALEVHAPHAWVISNPPYGERLGGSSPAVEMLYRTLGQRIKQVVPPHTRGAEGWLDQAWFFCANPRFESCLGLSARSRHRLANGPIETWFYGFSFQNTRPSKHAKGKK